MSKSEGRVLLPPSVEPKAYDISIEPNLVDFTFTGSEKIAVNVVSATKEVKLHAKEIYVSSASFTGSDGKTLEAVEVQTHLKDTVVTLVFETDLPVGEGSLSLDFRGDINNQMAGFYRSEYLDAQGNKKWMGSTQFESLDARRAFPCWDEPGRKATFTLTLTVARECQALSNMPESSNNTTGDGAKRVVSFLPTPLMSTYLLCWCVGDFDHVSALTKGGVLCKVYTPPGRGASGQFALDVAVKCLELYDDFFRVPYPLPKLDMIAIMDFAMGAMENWGLVTYREVDLLIDEAKASSQQRQRVASVVAHELAHQWFGNLVTMAWWDDLWLNEGFASWTQSFALDALFPDWGTWTQFIADDQATAMKLDALRTSHPIQVPIGRAEEVEEVFDAISYCKGASVVRMLHCVLGKDAFQEGLQLYMERHQYGNTETFHLWRAWEEVSGKPISQVMDGWTTQMGFPLVEVTGRSTNGDGSTVLNLKQSWFLADGSSGDSRLWTIPVNWANPDSITKGVGAADLYATETFSVTVPKAEAGSSSNWIKLNAGQHVPLRVAYDKEGYQQLIAAVSSGALAAEDRVGLLLDAYSLCKAGHAAMDVGQLLALVEAYKNEDDATVWEALETVLCALDKLLLAAEGSATAAAPAGLRSKFVAFAAKLVLPAAAKVGWVSEPQDGHLGKLKRASLVRLQAHFASQDDDVVKTARNLWNQFFDGDASVLPADFKVPVFKIVLANATTSTEFDQLMNSLPNTQSNAEKKHVYLALGATPNMALKKKVLEWAVSGSIKLQDFFYPIGSVSQSSPEGLKLAWQFYQDNFATIKGMVGNASASLMDAAIVYSVAGFATEAAAQEIEAYFKDPVTGAPKLPQNNRKISQTVEGIRGSAQFLNRVLASDLSILG